MDLSMNLPSIPDIYKKASYFRTISWDMQKSIHDPVNQWTLLKERLLQDRPNGDPVHEIAFVQNCDNIIEEMTTVFHQAKNPMTEGIINVDHVVDIDKRSNWDNGPYLTRHSDIELPSNSYCIDVREYEWKLPNRIIYVYHLYLNSWTHSIGRYSRVNLAILSCYRPQEVIVFQQTENDDKPILGIRINNRFFFNLDVRPTGPFLRDSIKYIESRVLVPALVEDECDVSWAICGSMPHTCNLKDNHIVHLVRESFIEKVHDVEENYTFAIFGDESVHRERLMMKDLFDSSRSVHCEVFDMTGAFLKPVIFWVDPLPEVPLDSITL